MADDLLNLAKGVDKDKVEEAQMTAYFTEDGLNKKESLKRRRDFRRTMFKIRRKIAQENDVFTNKEKAVKQLVENWLQPNNAITWNTFTFTWDVHPTSLGTFILKEHWYMEGGLYDELGAHSPTAFNQQEM